MKKISPKHTDRHKLALLFPPPCALQSTDLNLNCASLGFDGGDCFTIPSNPLSTILTIYTESSLDAPWFPLATESQFDLTDGVAPMIGTGTDRLYLLQRLETRRRAAADADATLRPAIVASAASQFTRHD